jgi:hypothetical protein
MPTASRNPSGAQLVPPFRDLVLPNIPKAIGTNSSQNQKACPYFSGSHFFANVLTSFRIKTYLNRLKKEYKIVDDF